LSPFGWVVGPGCRARRENRQAATGGSVLVVRTPPLRGIEGTQSGRVLRVRNVETPSGSGGLSGGLTVREAEFFGGNRMVQEANAGGRKAEGNRGIQISSPADRPA